MSHTSLTQSVAVIHTYSHTIRTRFAHDSHTIIRTLFAHYSHTLLHKEVLTRARRKSRFLAASGHNPHNIWSTFTGQDLAGARDACTCHTQVRYAIQIAFGWVPGPEPHYCATLTCGCTHTQARPWLPRGTSRHPCLRSHRT